MLKINPDPEFTTDIWLTVPGKEEPESLSVTFRYLTLKQMAELRDSLKGKKDVSDAEFLGGLIVRWKGADQDYSREVLEKLIENYPTSPSEFITQYNKHLLVSRVKN